MDYQGWIGRERRIRVSLLMGSPEIRNERVYRVCKNCGEVCLCYELTCPNCDDYKIIQEQFENVESEVLSGGRIRCRFRFKNIYQIEGKQDSP